MQLDKYIIRENQTLFDLALQLYGQVEYVFLLLQDNSSLNAIDASISAGTIINVRANEGNKAIVNAIADAKVVIATGDVNTTLEGIGYWGIEENFVIS